MGLSSLTVTDRETRIFGLVILEQRKVMERMVGPLLFEQALRDVPEERAGEYNSLGVLGWCRASTAAAVTEAVALRAGRQPEEFMADVVRQGFGVVLTGIWRFFARFSSDEAIVRRAATLYSKSCDRGEMRAHRVGPGHLEMRVTGWPDVGNLDLVAMGSGMEAGFRLLRRRNIRVRWRRDPQGATFTVRSTESEWAHFEQSARF